MNGSHEIVSKSKDCKISRKGIYHSKKKLGSTKLTVLCNIDLRVSFMIVVLDLLFLIN